MTDEMKVKAFNLIMKAYSEDGNLSQFGLAVQEILEYALAFAKA